MNSAAIIIIMVVVVVVFLIASRGTPEQPTPVTTETQESLTTSLETPEQISPAAIDTQLRSIALAAYPYIPLTAEEYKSGVATTIELFLSMHPEIPQERVNTIYKLAKEWLTTKDRKEQKRIATQISREISEGLVGR